MSTTVDPEDVARFSAAAERWWDPHGPFRPLHKFNPARLGVLREWIEAHFNRAPGLRRPFEGLDLLDIGCGGGLIAEPMARLGARVLGVDASKENVAVATAHRPPGLALDYQADLVENLASDYDIVLALEIIEHVADLDLFLSELVKRTRPGGLIVVATLNRTARSFATAILAAEYLLGWVPRGTHDWRKFVQPAELEGAITRLGLKVSERAGLSYNPLLDRWTAGSDLGVNYMLAFQAS